jgi:DNA-binding transcriptional regulator YdaS (Cro superfamily)
MKTRYPLPGLDKAVLVAGSHVKLAALLECPPSRLSMWRQRGRIPTWHVKAIEAATGVSRHELRPDIYADKA